MDKKIKSEISKSISGTIKMTGLLFAFHLVYVWFYSNMIINDRIILTISSTTVILLMVSLWFGTYYKIIGNTLIARSGILIWKIKINDIKFINLNQKCNGAIFKASLSRTCMEIKYRKYRTLFISPVQQESFVAKLKEINNNIVITEK